MRVTRIWTGATRIGVAFSILLLAGLGKTVLAAPLALFVVNATVTDVALQDGRIQPAGLSISLSPESALAFGEFTSANIGKRVELRIDGKPVLSAVIAEPIFHGRLRVGGDFSRAELKKLANDIPDGGIRMEAELVAP